MVRGRKPGQFREGSNMTFEQKVQGILHGMADLLVEKNAAYGNSALDPVRIFSKSDTTEQLYVRLDDKINRVKQGHEYPGDDTIRDIIGYCTLILIAREDNDDDNCRGNDG